MSDSDAGQFYSLYISTLPLSVLATVGDRILCAGLCTTQI